MKHDFYKAANTIIACKDTDLILTTGSDDICAPCIKCKDGICIDTLEGIAGYNQKNVCNGVLDSRIMGILNLDSGKPYKAKALCALMLQHHDGMYAVWSEEKPERREKRHDLFVAGAGKYLDL